MSEFSQKLTVTIAIPTLNEEKYIGEIIRTFQNNTYPHIKQILIADGGSTDRTCDIVLDYTKKDSRVQLILNPDRIQSAGLNKALAITVSELFIRADAHTLYTPNYVEECVNTHINHPDVINCGGAQRFKGFNFIQKMISISAHSVLGSGNAKYRKIDFNGYADTTYLGCFKTSKLKLLGGYNGKLPVNEDFELNFRIIKTFGEKSIFISSTIVCFYIPRPTLTKLAIQYFKYGLYKYFTSSYLNSFSLRSMLPVLIFLTIPFLLLTLLQLYPLSTLITLLAIYVLAIFDALVTVFKAGEYNLIIPSIFSPFAILMKTTSFSLGYLVSYWLKRNI